MQIAGTCGTLFSTTAHRAGDTQAWSRSSATIHHHMTPRLRSYIAIPYNATTAKSPLRLFDNAWHPFQHAVYLAGHSRRTAASPYSEGDEKRMISTYS